MAEPAIGIVAQASVPPFAALGSVIVISAGSSRDKPTSATLVSPGALAFPDSLVGEPEVENSEAVFVVE